MKTEAELLIELDIEEEHLQELARVERKNARNKDRIAKQIDDTIRRIETIKQQLKDKEKLQEVMYD